MSSQPKSYFVPDPKLLVKSRPSPYSLFINSSALENREHYVRIFAKGDVLTQELIDEFFKRYQQVYISEEERTDYLKGACVNLGRTEDEPFVVLKSSAIQHLDTLFQHKQEASAEVISQTLQDARKTVEGFVDMLKDYNLNQIHDLIGHLSFHDFYTYDHSINVSMYSILIYKLFVPDADHEMVVNAGMGGFLHDIGKIKIPNRIINKVGKLSDAEFNEIKKHPEYGYEFLNLPGITSPPGTQIEKVQAVVYQHHENYDGTGYPKQVRGAKIEFLARICAVADFFDAITTKRSYAEALSVEEALDLMKKSSGKKLDPLIFDKFLAHMTEKFKIKPCDFSVPTDFDPCQPHVKMKRG